MSIPLAHVGPREHLMTYGAERVATEDLVAVVLGSGVRGRPVRQIARELIERVGGIERLSRASPRELAQMPGIGHARAARLASAFHLGRRALEEVRVRRPQIGCAEHVYERLWPRFAGLEQEVFVVLALDVRCTVAEEIEVGRGSLTEVAVEPREVFLPLLRRGAWAAVVAHNHPSGDPQPSPDDITITSRLRQVGELVGIPIVDHVVCAAGGFTSIAEHLAP